MTAYAYTILVKHNTHSKWEAYIVGGTLEACERTIEFIEKQYKPFSIKLLKEV